MPRRSASTRKQKRRPSRQRGFPVLFRFLLPGSFSLCRCHVSRTQGQSTSVRICPNPREKELGASHTLRHRSLLNLSLDSFRAYGGKRKPLCLCCGPRLSGDPEPETCLKSNPGTASPSPSNFDAQITNPGLRGGFKVLQELLRSIIRWLCLAL